MYRDNSYILSLSVHKTLDYSTPIMFIYSSVSTPQKTETSIKKQSVPIPKNAIKKPAEQKTITTPPKTIVEKKTTIAEIKKPTPVATPAQKKVVEPVPPVPVKTEPKKEDVKQEAPKQEQKTVETPTIAQTLDVEQTVIPVIPENAHVSNNYREVEALRRNAQLQKELVNAWKPPLGVSPHCMCEISFFVNSKGAIEDLKMVKASGIIMYDISARQALFAMKMPQWTYGKPFTISFKQ